MKNTECPICKSSKAGLLLKLDCGNTDGSILYKNVCVLVCKNCGHIYNSLSSKEMANLKKYYNEESAPTHLGSPDKFGDRTGNTGPLTMQRYDKLYNTMSAYLKPNSRILDCGCAVGGFLDYLKSKGFNKTSGFEISQEYINQAKKWKNKIKLGDMETAIPFPDSSADFLVADQVIEHLYNLHKAFSEAKRVLSDGGYFCISVPDASRYSKNYFFDFYWFLLREHVEHFDLEHLKLIATLEGFELVTFAKYETAMMTEKMILPVLTTIFRISPQTKQNIDKKHFSLKEKIQKYIARDTKKLKNKKKIFEKIRKNKSPLYAWGIGREFMYIYEATGFKKCKIAGLIDANTYKQKKYLIGGHKIEDKSILKNVAPNSELVISAIAHIKPIKEDLKKIGYNGKVVNF